MPLEHKTRLDDVRIQIQLIVIFVHNILYNLIPFHVLKRNYLRLVGVRIGRQSYIHPWTRFTHPARLQIGDNCTINFGCYLDTRGGIRIGHNVMIGHGCKIYTAGHNVDDPHFSGYLGQVSIEDNAVIFPNVLIMPNVTICEGAVVYPGSVVAEDVAPFSIVGGNPARFLRQRSSAIQYKLDYKWWFANV